MAAVAETLLCFVVDLFARDSVPPRSLETAAARRLDLIFANRSRRSLAAHRRERRLRALISRLAEQLQPGRKADPELASILAERNETVTVLHLSYQAPAEEAAEKAFDFSRATLADRWQAGALDMAAALERLEALANTRDAPGLTVHDIRR